MISGSAPLSISPGNQFVDPVDLAVSDPADRMTNEQNGASYYVARVEITEVPKDLQDQIDLYPGMPAEVMIATGERTFFEYLIAPIARSFRRAFRED